MPYPFSYGLGRRSSKPQVGHPQRGRRTGVKAARRAARNHRR